MLNKQGLFGQNQNERYRRDGRAIEPTVTPTPTAPAPEHRAEPPVRAGVEASMDTRVIQIAESGALQGSVGVDVAEIRGRFDGELTVRKQLIIHPGGKVSGKIRYGKIMIEDGGEITGDVSTLAATKQQATATQSKPAPQLASN